MSTVPVTLAAEPCDRKADDVSHQVTRIVGCRLGAAGT